VFENTFVRFLDYKCVFKMFLKAHVKKSLAKV